MLKLIVPPPMELASVIAWRNEPVPLSLVFVTVKTKGATGLCTAGSDSCSTVASGSLRFPTRTERVDRVVREVLANVETSKSEGIDTSVKTRVTRSAKALADIFVFIFYGVELGNGCAGLARSSTEKQA